jgi:endonuclease/exonuclease/phosphatase family metal-dependent hydrolase
MENVLYFIYYFIWRVGQNSEIKWYIIKENKYCVQYLEDLYNFFSKLGNVIFVGDFNAQYDTILVSRIAQRKSGLIKQFMRSNSLVLINKTEICTGPNYMFAPLKPTIDYVLVCKSFCDCILLCKGFSNDHIDIASDHLSVYCKFNVPIRWYKADSTERPLLLGRKKKLQ